MEISTEQLKNHIKDNTSLSNYDLDIRRDLFDFDGLKLIVNVDKVGDRLLSKIQKNFELATERINKKLAFSKPTVGDFFVIENKVFRIASLWNDSEGFQYTEDGSFYMDKDGFCSYSGGFCFDFGSTFKLKDLKPTKALKMGGFWFFSNNEVKAHNGVHFKMDFKVWILDN